MDKSLQWAISRIMDTITPSFHGTFTLSFQAGKIHYMKIEKTERFEDQKN